MGWFGWVGGGVVGAGGTFVIEVVRGAGAGPSPDGDVVLVVVAGVVACGAVAWLLVYLCCMCSMNSMYILKRPVHLKSEPLERV